MLSNFQGVRKDKRVRLASFSPPGRRSRQRVEGASTEMCGELAPSSASSRHLLPDGEKKFQDLISSSG